MCNTLAPCHSSRGHTGRVQLPVPLLWTTVAPSSVRPKRRTTSPATIHPNPTIRLGECCESSDPDQIDRDLEREPNPQRTIAFPSRRLTEGGGAVEADFGQPTLPSKSVRLWPNRLSKPTLAKIKVLVVCEDFWFFGR